MDILRLDISIDTTFFADDEIVVSKIDSSRDRTVDGQVFVGGNFSVERECRSYSGDIWMRIILSIVHGFLVFLVFLTFEHRSSFSPD